MTNSMRRHNRPRPTSAKEVLQTPVANTKKLTILVDADLHRKFQLATIAKGRSTSLSFSSLSGWDEHHGKRDAFIALTDKCWRLRGYGDFLSYCFVAEGAVDIAAEPEVSLWDLAALSVLVTEAGGRFTSLAGEDGPHGGNAAATNGHLHDAVLEALG